MKTENGKKNKSSLMLKSNGILNFQTGFTNLHFEHRKQYPRNLPWKVDKSCISVRMPMEDKFKQNILPLFQDLFFQRTYVGWDSFFSLNYNLQQLLLFVSFGKFIVSLQIDTHCTLTNDKHIQKTVMVY